MDKRCRTFDYQTTRKTFSGIFTWGTLSVDNHQTVGESVLG